jgi:hypothetical protein
MVLGKSTGRKFNYFRKRAFSSPKSFPGVKAASLRSLGDFDAAPADAFLQVKTSIDTLLLQLHSKLTACERCP